MLVLQPFGSTDLDERSAREGMDMYVGMGRNSPVSVILW